MLYYTHVRPSNYAESIHLQFLPLESCIHSTELNFAVVCMLLTAVTLIVLFLPDFSSTMAAFLSMLP